MCVLLLDDHYFSLRIISLESIYFYLTHRFFKNLKQFSKYSRILLFLLSHKITMTSEKYVGGDSFDTPYIPTNQRPKSKNGDLSDV